MIGLDTNVLVRILVAEEQATRAAALVRRAIEAEELLFVSDVALCEVVWVLESAYGIGRPEISTALQSLLEARQLVFRDRDALGRAVEALGPSSRSKVSYGPEEGARRRPRVDVRPLWQYLNA